MAQDSAKTMRKITELYKMSTHNIYTKRLRKAEKHNKKAAHYPQYTDFFKPIIITIIDVMSIFIMLNSFIIHPHD